MSSIVQGLKFVLVYVDKLEPCQTFYETYLGFKKTAEFGPGEIYGELGKVEMWMGEGYQRSDGREKATRATVMIGVDSVGKLFKSLTDGGVPLVQDSPVEMQAGVFWLQFSDPAGNVIDVLGGE